MEESNQIPNWLFFKAMAYSFLVQALVGPSGWSRLFTAAVAIGFALASFYSRKWHEDSPGPKALTWAPPYTGEPFCALYGRSHMGAATEGNQCAAITDKFSPCRMEIEGLKPDGSVCDLAKGALHELTVSKRHFG